MTRKGIFARVRDRLQQYFKPFESEKDVDIKPADTDAEHPYLHDSPGMHQSDMRPDEESGESISTAIVCGYLEHLRRKRLFSIRKNGNRQEWKVRPASFADAYMFLLCMPHVDISRLQSRHAGDVSVFRMSFHDGKQIELTRKKVLVGEDKVVLRLTEGTECLMTIHFIGSRY